ncbi:hypothetical protein N7519_003935 [Penicillium mononematosum]|uniref:uncharacterized protein n=1 Tax=Penicillium mononematosum TaxID=268346 RepID=UPI002549066D|nr:uncharacterized protein N7519_003935 [Penicillium mononematosum]KAJ6189027.1 hypothetical protein N7519_003935 [Penicillium mononematosum]
MLSDRFRERRKRGSTYMYGPSTPLELMNFVGHSLDQYGVWGASWYSFNQQVIGSMDQDELICEQLR